MEKRVTAVLVAAGSSTRMGFDKLSFDLGGETVVQRSIRAFAECPLVDEIVLVAGKNREFLEQQAAACQKPVQVVPGGATRAESAKNGVLAASGEIVAVHDAARPFVSEAVIEAALNAAALCGAAAPAVPVKDTVKTAKRGDGKTVPKGCSVTETPDRSTLYAVQTPQCFDRAAYLAALDEDAKALYLMQIDSLDYAYKQLLQPGQEELLSEAGCADAAYPWSDSPIPAVESLMTALGARSAGAEAETSAGAASDMQSADSAPGAYAGILDAYYTAVTQQPEFSALPAGVNVDLYPFICQNSLGFCYYDANSDGVQELLIGPVGPDYSSAWIFDAYTVADGQCITLFQGYERDYLVLLSDGTLVNRSSSGASVNSDVFIAS